MQVYKLFAFEFFSLSTYWSANFLDLHGTPLQSGKCLPAHIPKEFRANLQKRVDQQEEGILTFLESFGEFKAFGVKRLKTC
jgi:hypothetical protein